MVDDSPMAATNSDFVAFEGLAPAIKEILESQPGSSTETGKLIKAKKRQRNRKLKESSNEVSSSKKSSIERRKIIDICRTKPDIAIDKEIERNFARIATKGVVQLFNVVKQHQTKIESVESSEKSEFKKEKRLSSISKEDFLDVLQGNNKKSPRLNAKNNVEAKWKVLRDDFLTQDDKL